MFNFAYFKKSKGEARAELARTARGVRERGLKVRGLQEPPEPDPMMAPEIDAAITALIDAMPDIPEGGAMLVSVRGNIPLGQNGANLLVEIAMHDSDPTA